MASLIQFRPFFHFGSALRIVSTVALMILISGQSGSAARQAPSPHGETGFLNRTVEVDGGTYGYQVYVPADYDPSRAWPVVLFLHGSGERGYDGLSQTQVGLGRAIRFNPERWPTLVVFPQIPSGQNWTLETEPIGMEALDQTMDEFAVDTSRVYLTGLSMGGYGSLFLATRHTDRFAAVVAVCPTLGNGDRYPFLGGSTYEEALQGTADALTSIPVWLFHGEDDLILPVSSSRDLTLSLQELGADVRYIEYADTGHNAWDLAYANTDMITWLFQQQNTPQHGSPDSEPLHH